MTYAEHATHGRWTQDGRCVYCPCGVRLFQGRVPKDQTKAAASLDEVVGSFAVGNQGRQR